MIKLFKNLTRRELGFALICVCMVVMQVWLELTMPDYTSNLTTECSRALSAGTGIETSVIFENGGKMILCALGSVIASIVCGFFAAKIGASLGKILRFKLFGRISSFSTADMQHFGVPSLITRTTNDVVQMQVFISMGLQVIVRAPIMAVWAITKISFANLYWTAAALITVACIVVCIGLLVKICFPKFRLIQKLTDDLNDVTRENITGVRVVRAFNAEDYQENRFEKVNNDVMKTNLFTSRTMGLMSPVMTICMNGLTLAIYWIGAYLINSAALPDKVTVIGNMVAFTQYAMQIVMSFMMLTMVFVILPRVMVSARRIQEVIDTEPSITYETTPVKKTVKGKIAFKNVSFGYGSTVDRTAGSAADSSNADAGRMCLQNLDFTVEPGETFAIIGATGTGKTSVINLIPRFYDVTSGSVELDDVDIRNYPKDQLESMVSIAPQKAVLFGGTVRSNVAYSGDPEDSARIQGALDIAQAEFVADLEDGLDAYVAQGGSNFSGGQKQRLSIARAVFKDAEIYIFDDTFSALDYKTDMLVRKALHEKLSGRTIIIVAQRIGTIMNADKIMVLEEGRIAGIGTHKELLENCPVYKEIALSQLGEEEL